MVTRCSAFVTKASTWGLYSFKQESSDARMELAMVVIPFEMFKPSLTRSKSWSEIGFVGARRFLTTSRLLDTYVAPVFDLLEPCVVRERY